MDKTLTIVQPKLRIEDPHNCTDAKDVLAIFGALFDSLVSRGPDMHFMPALADSWQVEEGARAWTFHLRDGMRFHNGDPVDTESVKYSLERMSRADMGVTLGAPGVYHQYLAGMDITVLDSRRIRLTTAQPLADLLDILSTGYILSPAAVEKAGADFKRHPVGSGPYEFVEHLAGDRIQVKRRAGSSGDTPGCDAIEWRYVPDPAQRVRMVAENQAQIATALNPADLRPAGTVSVSCSRCPTAYILMFNAGRGPFQDRRLRLALNFAVDRQELIQRVLGGAGYALAGFVSPQHWGADPGRQPYRYDPGHARKLLKAAGFANGLQVVLDSPTSLPDEAPRLSQVLVEQLGRIGVEVKVNTIADREAYAHQVRLKQIHDMCVFDSSPLSTFRVLREKIDSRFKGSWWQGYRNTDVEALLDQAAITIDDARRERLYRECFRLLCEDPPWLFLYNHQEITGVAPALSGWRMPDDGIINVRTLTAK
jgi:peptide/nickel transport system substrate-binding protein